MSCIRWICNNKASTASILFLRYRNQKENGEVQVNMQRIMRNARSFSGLVINLTKILNIERWNKAWIELCLISYGWYVIKNAWRRKKK